MAVFPQPIISTVAVTATTYAANSGDVVLFTPTAASVVDLPPNQTQGASVTICNLAAFTVTAKTTDGTQVNGVAGTTGVAVASGGTGASMTKATFVFNGTAWYAIA